LACVREVISPHRTIIGCKSVDGVYESHPEFVKGHVRATVWLAGFDIQRLPTGEVQLTYICQTDLKSETVPNWIVNKVKLEQLESVRKINGCLMSQISN